MLVWAGNSWKVHLGKETNPLWTSQISNSDFRYALKESLSAVNLLNITNNSKYEITARLLEIKHPMLGLDLTVTSKIKYKIRRKSDDAVLFYDVIQTSYKATVGDSLIAATRLKKAIEGSARMNIEKIIDTIYSLKIDAAEVSLK